MDEQPTRRSVLSAAGAAGMAATGAGCLVRGDWDADDAELPGAPPSRTTPQSSDEDHGEPAEKSEPPENGAVALVYDDGPIHDYTEAFPVHQEFDAPAVTCPVTGWIGTQQYGVDRLDVHHLRVLADAGWEIASHTVEHATLGEFELTADAGPDATRVYPEEIRHGHHSGKVVEITDGERTVRRTVAGLGRAGDDVRYVELETPLGAAFEARETVVRYPAEQMRYTLGESRRELESYGFEVDTLLAPYDNFGEYAMEFVPEYYDFVANARSESRVNSPPGVDPYRLQRDYFVEFTTREAVQRALDEIAEVGGLGVFGAHAWKQEVTEDRIRETLTWIEERDIQVMTVREACRRFVDAAKPL